MAEKLDKVDVAIVGAGWTGGVAAAELAKKGYQVVGLERGKDQSIEDFIGSKDELRYKERNELQQDLTKQTMTTRNTLDEEAKPIRTHKKHIYGTDTGGTGVHWSGQSFRFLPFDFEIRSKITEKYGKDRIPEDMPLQDWGITYDELEPYYDKFEKTIGLAGEENPLGSKRSDKHPNPPMKETPVTRLFKDAAKNLGYHPYHSPSAFADKNYENPDGEQINACVYCSFCTSYGCDFGAKADPITTVLSTAKKTGNYELRNNAYVTRVLHNEKKATGVLYTNPQTGQEYEQPADIVIIASFIFGNTRLMLLSEIGEPYDPKTKKGVIGKNITQHYTNIQEIGGGATGFFEEKKFNTFAGAGPLGATLDDFGGQEIDNNETDFLHGFRLSIGQGDTAAIGNNVVPKGTPTWGNEFKEKSLHYAYRHLTVGHMGGALPNDNNYMDLDPNYKDVFGDPLLRITTKYTDNDRNLYKYAREKAAELMEEMGADIVETNEITDDMEFSQSDVHNHAGGGVIMGDNPEISAVNNYSQVWDMENLFVIGASSFPHFSQYNPTVTACALSYRATEGMIEYLEGDGGLLIEPKERSDA